MDLDAVRDRWAEVGDGALRDALERAARERVVEWIYREMGSYEHRPGLPERPQRPLSGPQRRMVRVGLDAHGRPAIAETVADERVHRSDVITWSGDQAELLALREGALEDLRVTTFAGGRPAWTISTMGDAKLDGRPAVEMADHRRPELEMCVYESNAHRSWGLERGPYWGWKATRRAYGDDGRLMLVEYVAPTEHGIADGQGVEAALAAATEAYERGAYTSSVGWDGRVLALEEPPQDRMTVLEGLAPALADAIHAAVGAHPAPLAFVWVELRLIGGSEGPVIPRAVAVDVAYRDRARDTLGGRDEILDAAFADHQAA